MQGPPIIPRDDTLEVDKSPAYEQALNSIGDPLFVLDTDLKFISFNRAFKEWLHILDSEVSLQGKHLVDVLPFFCSTDTEEYERVFETGEMTVDSRCLNVDNRQVFVEIRKIPVFKEEKVIRVVTVIRDVTEQRLLERTLTECSEQFRSYQMRSEQRFSTIFDESPVSICVFDKDGILTDANQACARMFGLACSDSLLGFSIFEAPDVSDWVMGKIRNGEQVDFEWMVDLDSVSASRKYETSKTGTIHIGTIVSPLLDNGHVNGWIVQMQDITRWRYAQFEIQRATDLAMEYMDMMSHDIANHLQSMVLCSGLLGDAAKAAGKERVLAMLDEAISECIKTIVQAREISSDDL